MLLLRNFRKCCYWEIFVSCTTQECKMLQHLAIQFLLYMHYLSSACCLWEVKNKENFKLLALKDKWSRSLTQGGQEVPNIMIWLGKLQIFWKTGCRWEVVVYESWSQQQVRLYRMCLVFITLYPKYVDGIILN